MPRPARAEPARRESLGEGPGCGRAHRDLRGGCRRGQSWRRGRHGGSAARRAASRDRGLLDLRGRRNGHRYERGWSRGGGRQGDRSGSGCGQLGLHGRGLLDLCVGRPQGAAGTDFLFSSPKYRYHLLFSFSSHFSTIAHRGRLCHVKLTVPFVLDLGFIKRVIFP